MSEPLPPLTNCGPKELKLIVVSGMSPIGDGYDKTRFAALDKLVAELGQVKKERDEERALRERLMQAVEQDEDAWVLTSEPITDDDCPCLKPSHRKLEVERDRLAEALREIEGLVGYGSAAAVRVARAALASMEGAKKDTNIPPVQTENPAGHTEVRTTYSSLAEGDK